MNVWRSGPLLVNPYGRTPFRVARVPREVVRHKLIVQLIGQTRRVVRTTPQAHAIRGKPVSDAEINTAEQVLLEPARRIVAELLHHATETPPLQRVRALMRQASEAMSAQAKEPAAAPNLEALRPWAHHLVARFVEEQNAPDPSFGAMELECVPPFGRTTERER